MIQPSTTQERAKQAVRATAIVIAVALHALSALAQTAKDIKGATPLVAIQNEAPARLIVDPPIPEQLALGRVFIQYRTENCRILPIFGKAALKLSPRVGHLHVRVDDLPWLWAHTSDINTIDIGGMPPGEHKVTIALVDAMHQVYPGQSKTVKFKPSKRARPSCVPAQR